MDRELIETTFPVGNVDIELTNHKGVILIWRLLYLALGAFTFWEVRHAGDPFIKYSAYIVIAFCLWRAYHQGDTIVFVGHRGFVLQRRAASILERFDRIVHPEDYYQYIPYTSYIGFTEDWSELYIVTCNNGIMVIRTDMLFVSYRDKMKLLNLIDERSVA